MFIFTFCRDIILITDAVAHACIYCIQIIQEIHLQHLVILKFIRQYTDTNVLPLGDQDVDQY